MSMFDYMKKRFSRPTTAPTEAAPDADALLKERIKKLVYDEDVADKLLPVFSKLQGDEYIPLWELLEAKESIITTELGDEFFEQEYTPDPVQSEAAPEEESVMTAEEIILAKYHGV